MAKFVKYLDGMIAYEDENGDYHREDGPAVIWPEGSKYWYHHGNQHYTDWPSDYHSSGIYTWYAYGIPGRANGPAENHPNGYKIWLHRDEQIWPTLG